MLILEINGNLRTPVRIELFNKGSLEIPRAHILWWWESHKDKNGRRRSSATSSSSSPVSIIYIIDFMLVSWANPELFPEEGFVCQDGRSPIFINMLCAIKKYEISSGSNSTLPLHMEPLPLNSVFEVPFRIFAITTKICAAVAPPGLDLIYTIFFSSTSLTFCVLGPMFCQSVL